MDDDVCKNLLCERICDCCRNKEDGFTIHECKKFPYRIPRLHTLMIVEVTKEGFFANPVIVYIKDGKIFIKAEDFKKGCTYLLHFQYPYCKTRDDVLPQENTCDRFQK